MKKITFFLFLFFICFNISAFDDYLIGSWGITFEDEKQEFIRINVDEIIIIDTLVRSDDYYEVDNSIFIDDFDGDTVLLQHHLLAQNKLLFILTNMDDPTESITLILSKL